MPAVALRVPFLGHPPISLESLPVVPRHPPVLGRSLVLRRPPLLGRLPFIDDLSSSDIPRLRALHIRRRMRLLPARARNLRNSRPSNRPVSPAQVLCSLCFGHIVLKLLPHDFDPGFRCCAFYPGSLASHWHRRRFLVLVYPVTDTVPLLLPSQVFYCFPALTCPFPLLS